MKLNLPVSKLKRNSRQCFQVTMSKILNQSFRKEEVWRLSQPYLSSLALYATSTLLAQEQISIAKYGFPCDLNYNDARERKRKSDAKNTNGSLLVTT